MKLNSDISPCIEIHSKWINGFNLKSETSKLLEENQEYSPSPWDRQELSGTSPSNSRLDHTSILFSVCTLKKLSSEHKDRPQNVKKIFTFCFSQRGNIQNCEEEQKLSNKETKLIINQWTNTLNKQLSKMKEREKQNGQ